MNIAELPIAGIAFTPSDTSSPTAGLADVPGAPRFNDVLSSLLGQLSDPTHSTHSTPGSLLQQLLALQGTGANNIQDIASVLTDGKADSFAQLGQTLLTLVSQLLEGAKADVKTDELMPLLNDIMGSLASDKDTGDVKNVLIKLFANVKQSLTDGELHGKLADLTKDLPEMLKLKIHLIEHSSGKHSSDQEVAKIQYMLVAKLIGLTEQTPSVGEGSQTSDMANSVTGLLSEKLMVKFHITPGQPVVGMEGSNGRESVVTDTPVPAVDPSLIGMSDNQDAGDSTDAATDPVLDLKGDEAKAGQTKSQITDAVAQGKHQAQSTVKSADILAEAVNAQQATDRVSTTTKTTPNGHSVVHATVKVTAVKAADTDATLTDSQNGNQSTADPGTTTTSTSSSTPSYAVGAENKSAFANEMSKAAVTTAAGHAAVNAEHVLKQVVEKFEVLMAEGRSEAKIQLKPKYLGELKIHLVMENGTIKAALDAPSHHVKEILESNLSSLKQALEDQGFDVKGFDVSVGHRHNNHNHGFGRFKGASFMGESHQEPIGEIERIRPSVTLNRYGHKVVNFLA
ncbi:MAG: flagellar hook-length control protein FliK [Candidatus Aquicultor sp.]